MLVVLHGLSGGSHEIYLRHIIAPLGAKGWEACVVNFRGCAKSKVTSSILYNARATWDFRQTVQWLQKTFPQRPLFGIGFSLGANVLTNVRISVLSVSFPFLSLRVFGTWSKGNIPLPHMSVNQRSPPFRFSPLTFTAKAHLPFLS